MSFNLDVGFIPVSASRSTSAFTLESVGLREFRLAIQPLTFWKTTLRTEVGLAAWGLTCLKDRKGLGGRRD